MQTSDHCLKNSAVCGCQGHEFGSDPLSTKDWYALQLRSCQSLDEGKIIHDSIRSSGHRADRFLGNILIQMYTREGSLELALKAFKDIKEPNVFSWTILVAAFAGDGQLQQAFQVLCTMQNEGVKPNEVTVSSMLTACRNVKLVQQLQRLATTAGFGDNERILRSLIHSYGECGSVEEARDTFDKVKGDIVSYTAIVGAYSRNGRGAEALELFERVSLEGFKHDKVSLITGINACACAKDWRSGERYHIFLKENGLDTDLTLQNTLLGMYGKCGRINELLGVFLTIETPDVVSYNSMVSALAHNACPELALFFFNCMMCDGSQPTLVTFISIAHACGCVGDSQRAAEICSWVDESAGVSANDAVLRSAIVAMQGRVGYVEAAKQVFESYPLEELSCTSMIATYVQNQETSQALHLFRSMQLQGIRPNKVTFLSILDACGSEGQTSQAKVVHCSIVHAGLEADHEIGNAMINMYGKCGCLDQAKKIFEMKQHKDVLTWTGMSGSYAINNDKDRALRLFKEMQLDGIKPNKVAFVVALDACANSTSSILALQGRKFHDELAECGLDRDVTVGNCLINMYASCGNLNEAKMQLERMGNQRNRTSWNTMICGLTRSKGHEKQALELMSRMELEGISPDSITLSLALEACTSLAALDRGRLLHARVSDSGKDANLVLQTCLVNLYGQCGRVDKARQVFDKLASKDIVLWNAMSATYARHGLVEESVELFRALVLQGIVPDRVTFISIMAAICHCHQDEEAAATEYFFVMYEFMVKPGPEHFTCMVDLLARRGRLFDAEELLKAMPFRPEGINLVSLLAACKCYHDVGRAESTAEFIMELDPTQAPAYVLLSDVYAAAATLTKTVASDS